MIERCYTVTVVLDLLNGVPGCWRVSLKQLRRSHTQLQGRSQLLGMVLVDRRRVSTWDSGADSSFKRSLQQRSDIVEDISLRNVGIDV